MTELQELKNSVDKIRGEMATNEKVQQLIDLIAAKDERIAKLEDRVAELERSNGLFERKLDDLESYGRRQNIRIVGIPAPAEGKKETAEEVTAAVKTVLEKLKVPHLQFNRDVVRAHRVGKKFKDKNNRTVHPVIVRFISWRSRTDVYRKRSKDGNIRIYPDLTKRRTKLRKDAEELVKDNENISYVFADVNNNIGAKLKTGKLAFFNSTAELQKVMEDI